MLILGLALLGLLGIVFAGIALRANQRKAKSGTASARWLLARRWSWLLSIALGIASYFIWYPLQDHGEIWRVVGFPFFAAAFDPRGSDYVGITTIPAVIGNFLFFAGLPQFILLLTGRSRGRSA